MKTKEFVSSLKFILVGRWGVSRIVILTFIIEPKHNVKLLYAHRNVRFESQKKFRLLRSVELRQLQRSVAMYLLLKK